MNFFSDRSTSFSQSIDIYHNRQFSYSDIEYVLAPIFADHYGIERLRSIISSADHIWAAYDKRINHFIACAIVKSRRPNENILYVKLFGVEQSSQGQGIGTRLLQSMKKWARKHQYFAIMLHTQVNNFKAIGLYEKVGFQKQKYLKNFFHRHGSLSASETDAYEMVLYVY